MLSILPQILFLAPFTPFLLRIAIGITFAYSAWKLGAQADIRHRLVAFVSAAVCVLILAGAWTQAAALVGFCVTLVWLAFPSTRTLPLSTTLLILVMNVCLVISGAGLFALDLPL